MLGKFLDDFQWDLWQNGFSSTLKVYLVRYIPRVPFQQTFAFFAKSRCHVTGLICWAVFILNKKKNNDCDKSSAFTKWTDWEGWGVWRRQHFMLEVSLAESVLIGGALSRGRKAWSSFSFVFFFSFFSEVCSLQSKLKLCLDELLTCLSLETSHTHTLRHSSTHALTHTHTFWNDWHYPTKQTVCSQQGALRPDYTLPRRQSPHQVIAGRAFRHPRRSPQTPATKMSCGRRHHAARSAAHQPLTPEVGLAHVEWMTMIRLSLVAAYPLVSHNLRLPDPGVSSQGQQKVVFPSTRSITSLFKIILFILSFSLSPLCVSVCLCVRVCVCVFNISFSFWTKGYKSYGR